MVEATIRVIVVAYRSGESLRGSIDSALSSKGVDVSVTIVNNDPADPEPGGLAQTVGADYIAMAGNPGFCVAVNQALVAATEPYVLLLNPDAVISTDYLARLVDRMEDDQTLGSVGGKIFLGLGKDSSVIDSLGIEMANGRQPRDVGHGLPDDGRALGSFRQRFGVTAAAALYRRSALQAVKVDGQVLPEDFFMYLDDVDLAWRLRLWGYQSAVDERAIAWHERAAGRGPRPDVGKIGKLAYAAGRPGYIKELSWANLYLMLLRNDSPALFLESLAEQVALRLPRDVFTVLHDVPLALRQRLRLATRLRRSLAQRKYIQMHRAVGQREMRRWLA